MGLHSFAKAVTPGPVWRAMAEAKAKRLYAKLERTKAAEFYRAYFAPKVESIYSTVQTTGELHNFTYDLTERNLGYLIETISCALGKSREEITRYIQVAQG